MTKQSGIGDNLLVGAVNVSGDIGSLSSIHGGPATLDVTGINEGAYERIGGQRDGGISFACWFNDATGAEHLTLRGLPLTDVQLLYTRGTALGSAGASMISKQINYDWSRATDGALTGAVDAQANGFGLEWGLLVTPNPRTDTTATTGASVDFTDVTFSFGLQMYLHVLAFTGTSITVKLQDSADNTTFTDITSATFTAATAAGVQRVALPAPAVVRRYIRAVSTGTFSNAVYVVNVVRNIVAAGF